MEKNTKLGLCLVLICIASGFMLIEFLSAYLKDMKAINDMAKNAIH